MKWFRFILSHSIFISICAAALCYQTEILLDINTSPLVYLMVFSFTLAGYNLYWLLTDYTLQFNSGVRFLKKNIAKILLVVISSVLAAYSLLNLLYLWPVLLIGMVLTALYSVPLWPFNWAKKRRHLGFLKTSLLAFTWSFITVAIPVYGSAYIVADTLWLLIARFFFMLMLCAIFDSRDSKVDLLNNLHSLATDVSPKALRVIMLVVFVLFIFAGIQLRLLIGKPEQLAAFIFTGIIALWVYRLSLKPRGYIFYYFVVDGLMLLSGVLTFVAGYI